MEKLRPGSDALLQPESQATAEERLFVALDLPKAVRQRLEELKKHQGSFKWTPRANLHLTLRFIGPVKAPHREEIQTALGQVKFEAFPLKIKGLGFFERKNGTVLWAAAQDSRPLSALAEAVNRVYPPNPGPRPRPFSPHITLARLKKTDRQVLKNFVSQYSRELQELFTVEYFTLYQSRLYPSGAVYTALNRYAATGRRLQPSETGQ